MIYSDTAVVTHHDERGESSSSSSQPRLMARMLSKLEVHPGMKILEIGTGTGYNAALLANLTGAGENVWTIDVQPDVCQQAIRNLSDADHEAVNVICSDGIIGLPMHSPFDRIIVTAGVAEIPLSWFTQLAEGGIIVAPWSPSGQVHRVIALQRHGSKLTMIGSLSGGFMPIQSATSGVNVDAEGREWFSSGLTTAEIEKLYVCMTSDAIIFPVQVPSITPESELDLRSYIAIGDPHAVSTMRRIPNTKNTFEARFGLMDHNKYSSSVSLVELDRSSQQTMIYSHHEQTQNVVIYSYGTVVLQDRLLNLIDSWYSDGQPTFERLELSIHFPHYTGLPSLGERVVRRRWGDYLCNWRVAG
jgi:protein-L-isoaspartate(D-aspartate) O-methyltransferase